MSTSEQLEREAEASRASISYHLDELRSRMTAGEVVDQVMDYARNGTAGQFAQNLRRQVVGNPLPVALIGAGIGWLLISGGRAPAGRPFTSEASDLLNATAESATEFGERLQQRGSRAAEGASSSAREAADSLSEKARSTAAGAREYAQQAKSRLSESARSAGSTAAETVSSLGRGATERLQQSTDAARETSSALLQRAAETNRQAMSVVRDQPLVIVGVGLALGSILGALLPGTKTEDQWMGEASDELKSTGTETLSHQADSLKAAVGAGSASSDASPSASEKPQDQSKKEDQSKNEAPKKDHSSGASVVSQPSTAAESYTLESPATVPTDEERASEQFGTNTNVSPGRS
jgi:ElaB/YqjD/DUF883 family membrane-anchored ribosome-binding protein